MSEKISNELNKISTELKTSADLYDKEENFLYDGMGLVDEADVLLEKISDVIKEANKEFYSLYKTDDPTIKDFADATIDYLEKHIPRAIKDVKKLIEKAYKNAEQVENFIKAQRK